MSKLTDKEKYIPYLIEALKQRLLPAFLYKHMDISDKFYRTIIDSTLFFSSPKNFNDPFDCQIEDQTEWNEENIRGFFKELESRGNTVDIERIIRIYKSKPESFAPYFTGILNMAVNRGGVTCFVKSPKNPLLWAHYSNKHEGVCLKFDIREDYNLFAQTFKVNYSKKYPKIDFIKNRDEFINKVLSTKPKIWAYEHEIRSIQLEPGPYPFNKSCLKEIIFGCRTTSEKINEIKKIIAENNYKDIVFKQVKLVQKSFDIEIIEI